MTEDEETVSYWRQRYEDVTGATIYIVLFCLSAGYLLGLSQSTSSNLSDSYKKNKHEVLNKTAAHLLNFKSQLIRPMNRENIDLDFLNMKTSPLPLNYIK